MVGCSPPGEGSRGLGTVPSKEKDKQPYRQTPRCREKSAERLTVMENHKWHHNTDTKGSTHSHGYTPPHTHTHKVPRHTMVTQTDTQMHTISQQHTYAFILTYANTPHTNTHGHTDTHSLKRMHKEPLTLGLGSPGGWRQDPQLQGLSLLPTLWRAGLIMGQYHLDSRTLSLHFAWGLLPTEPFPEAGFTACPRAHRRLTQVLDNDTAMFGDQSSLLTKETSPFASHQACVVPHLSPNKTALSLHKILSFSTITGGLTGGKESWPE